MRSSLLATALATLALGAGCAPKGTPVCQPVFSYATPAYSCGVAEAAVPVVEAPPPLEAPPPVDKPPPPPQILATLGEKAINLAEKIQFKTGSPELLPESSVLLDQIAQILIAHPEVTKVRVEGYTDSLGANGKNLALSQARAEAVRTYLQKAGVAAGRMVAKGFGEAKPISDNSTTAGREQNRRVEITILKRAK